MSDSYKHRYVAELIMPLKIFLYRPKAIYGKACIGVYWCGIDVVSVISFTIYYDTGFVDV